MSHFIMKASGETGFVWSVDDFSGVQLVHKRRQHLYWASAVVVSLSLCRTSYFGVRGFV